MRKRIKIKKLSRSTNQRKALFRHLIIALVKHGQIKTTQAKAKAVRRLVEKLITKGKQGTLHSRRLIQRIVLDRQTANKIVEELGQRYANIKGGYTRITPLGNRRGDNAPMVLLSLVEKETKKTTQSKSSTRQTTKRKTTSPPKSKPQSAKKTPTKKRTQK